jgi:alpha-beta hydrolase superfamily lysophospholipase
MNLPSSDDQFEQICGYQIRFKTVIPNRARAHIIFVHGLGEHGNRYDGMARKFNMEGFATTQFDLPGHGQSSGVRGDISRYYQFYTLIDHFKNKLTHLPSILFAHSMGGNIAFNYLLQKSEAPCICASIGSPWIQLTFKPSNVKILFARLAMKFAPKMIQKTNLETSGISRVAEEVRRYSQDRLIHSYISPRLFTLIQTKGLRLKKRVKNLNTPIFLYHGKLDIITSFKASKELSELSTSISFTAYQEAYHEIHNEPEKDSLFASILAFYNQQLEKNDF